MLGKVIENIELGIFYLNKFFLSLINILNGIEHYILVGIITLVITKWIFKLIIKYNKNR